jgi:hypothetical protein
VPPAVQIWHVITHIFIFRSMAITKNDNNFPTG